MVEKYKNLFLITVKLVLSGHSNNTLKIGYQYRLSLNASRKHGSIQTYFRPLLSYHFQKISLFCLFLKWPHKSGFNVHTPIRLVGALKMQIPASATAQFGYCHCNSLFDSKEATFLHRYLLV